MVTKKSTPKTAKISKKKEIEKFNPAIIVGACMALIAAVCVVIAICISGGGDSTKPDNNVNGKQKPAIVGSWKYPSMEAIYTFNEDGTCSYKYYDNVRNCTYTDSGNSIELLYDGDTMASNYKYHVEDGKTLHIEDSIGSDVIYERQ